MLSIHSINFKLTSFNCRLAAPSFSFHLLKPVDKLSLFNTSLKALSDFISLDISFSSFVPLTKLWIFFNRSISFDKIRKIACRTSSSFCFEILQINTNSSIVVLSLITLACCLFLPSILIRIITLALVARLILITSNFCFVSNLHFEMRRLSTYDFSLNNGNEI
ncbi:hypothetical protein LLB_3761 [Legionella longbeachae D-4968]|nr:hypothetical protein LLB_3761 [Legionella longbeachae D-4968]